MALTPEVRASQLFVTSITGGATPDVQASQFFVTAVANIPAEYAEASQFFVTALTGGASPEVQVSQLWVTAVVRGRIDNHRLRAWTYSMDGHDFYVLQLGEQGTLVCDLTTGQWMQWKSPERTAWRACLGTNWIGIGAGALNNVSTRANVVAGDDTYGAIWVLAPTQGYDESPIDSAEEVPFTRTVMAGVPMRMRQTAPCNEVYLLGSKGGSALTVTAQEIALRTSDDAERTWTEQGTITITPEEWDQEWVWRSLGIMGAPGRMFEFTDNCIARLDGVEIR